MSDQEFDRTTVLGKVMSVLHAFTVDDSAVSLAELCRRTSIPKGTLHRVLADMVAVRMLDRTDAGYRLGGSLFELGMRASVERSLLEVAIPFMEDLYVRTHETVHLGVLDGTEVVYLSKIGGHRQASAPSRIGGRMPVHCTAIGKVLVAHADNALQEQVLAAPLPRYTPRTIVLPGPLRTQLDRIATEGVAYEYEESATGIVCVAAPVRDGENVVAAISVTGPSHRFRPEAHTSSVRTAAEGIGVTLARRSRLLAEK
ncbi:MULTISPECIES: IclR family transcriptional regulator [unclassified Rhodococcus (in: high G+C Gram-positive bacteria)]|uniref:IclR family transcriptional regulator n=1 Tax=unclassified Rhodococcus (in: high G+C Gram-positive bacteria) TaxID=192944 RepID=UPI00163AA52E|nr:MULTISPECIES: IclR family transcriptional regulator [unclassified Rhodococcus (in: high G+C Gram-positive bacteria)]MBC2641019.1 IclR family transcriptional regulator [Rhodococcus sp. 3A]MBC2894236.1 IclR family transcriptional regulator [Rhodococcus sp. 4CII]